MVFSKLEMSSFLTNQNGFQLSPNVIVYIMLGVIGFFFIILLIRKIYNYVRFRKNYYIIPNISTQGIANTAMVIAISIAVILLLTVVTAGFAGIFFRVYPGWRATVEGILIKIGGLLFGPIIGLFIGAITDLLTVALTAGMFHYGFFLISIFYGFLAGIIRIFINMAKQKTIAIITFSTILTILITTVVSFYIYFVREEYSIMMFSIQMNIPNYIIMFIFIGSQLLFIILSWILIFIFKRDALKITFYKIFFFFHYKFFWNKYNKKIKNKKNNVDIYVQKMIDLECKNLKKYHEKIIRYNTITKKYNEKNSDPYSWLILLLTVIMLIGTCEPLIEILLMPVFDYELGGGIQYEYWIFFRIIFSFIIAFVNLFVVFPIYSVVIKLIRYDYRTDIVGKNEN